MKKPKQSKLPKTLKGIGVRTYRIMFDEDYIYSKEYDNSLEKCLSTNPEGVPNSTACKLLMLETREHDAYLSEAEGIIRQYLEQ